jgi:hypothetical protein
MTPFPLHKAYALGLFRSSVFFVFAVAAFAEADRHTGTILITAVFLLDVTSWHIVQVLLIDGQQTRNNAWADLLANRFIFEKILERFRDRKHIEFQEMVREGTQAAAADIVIYMKDNTIWSEWGWFKRTLAGTAYFLWFWISYGIFYGIAGFLGSGAGRGY